MQSLHFLKNQFSPTKNLIVSLKKILGLSFFNALVVSTHFGFNQRSLCSDLTLTLVKRMQAYCVSEFLVQDKLFYQTKSHVRSFINLKTVKGLRHKLRLPVRGQRTHTNRKTARRSLLGSL